MALLNLKTVIYNVMPVAILLNTWTHDTDGLLVVKPQDTKALTGQVATVNCSTSLTEDVHWHHGTSYVYAGRKLYSPYTNRLKIEVYQNDGATSFNLVFPSASPEDAGTYVCRDNQGSGEMSSAEMTVFTADGNGACQSNMKPDEVVIPNDCNIDPDEVQLSCSVTYYGSIPPQLAWKKVPDNGYSAAKTECQTTNNRIICNASITGDRQMNRSSYVCQTAGSSQLNIKLCTIDVKNLIYALNGQTMAKSSVGNEVQCNTVTSQPCNYKWKHSGIVVSTSRTITPDEIGLYQCEAECNIRGKRCVVFDYAQISDDDSASNFNGYVEGISVLFLLLFITIVPTILVYVFLLRKIKDASQRVQDLEMKTQENETQRERTMLLQPCNKIETST